MSAHSDAVTMLRASGLSQSEQQDLYEMYQEDCEEYSEYTALEKLETGIRDTKHKED